ncbi:unnamed protein product [Darwinula stevensoni]|uniref:chitin synthase n=1 Tax=Darwinula stevensoni TaxID=69355 RepID=A0A7R8X1H3_9CRUS|nr:unnamed protein product [Darwinula stevensoni]CAG0880273.1 unnamed protein product [Darwinula stevensoni]
MGRAAQRFPGARGKTKPDNRDDKRDDRVKKEGKKKQEGGIIREKKKSEMDRVERDTGAGGASGSEEEDGFSDQEEARLISDDAVAEGGVSLPPKWDAFREIPPDIQTGSSAQGNWIKVGSKVLKFLTYIFTFVFVLGSSCIALSTALFMTTQLKVGRMVPHCNRLVDSTKEWEANISYLERIAWIWAVFFVLISPEVYTFIRSFRFVIFKTTRFTKHVEGVNKGLTFAIVWTVETLHTIGLFLLAFVVLPELDVLRGVMFTSCVCFVPSVLGLFFRARDAKKTNGEEESEKAKKSKATKILAIILDILAVFLQSSALIIWPYVEYQARGETVDIFILSLPLSAFLISLRWWENYFYVSKDDGTIILMFIGVIIYVKYILEDDLSALFTSASASFGQHLLNVTEVQNVIVEYSMWDVASSVPVDNTDTVRSRSAAACWLILIHIATAWICYTVGKFACKIRIQGTGFAFPLTLAVPVTTVFLFSACGWRNENLCAFHGVIPDYLFWECPSGDFLDDFIKGQFGWLGMMWLLSQLWTTVHIWTPTSGKLATTDLLFVNPWYVSLLLAHIFFDDAYTLSDDGTEKSVVNKFVKDLIEVIPKAASVVHGVEESVVKTIIRNPKRYPTPYGGRLVWTLPGKSKIICHLKDKNKIRHKKRWSQCMYMYYLLGYKLMEREDLPSERKDVMAENTFILALDGDIDFQPLAVRLLVTMMKRDKNLGAACGRIHPVGRGPMVWFQLFEYAIGHWLQKATEHMIGCVLCSPGCFSLFRGKALMSDNVMKKYTAVSKEALHYVQFDQGEDRWLCTLLLQQGYRVEYSAACDSFTHSPEGFNEFYNQRRRWVPSTMANIMDLIGDYKSTVAVNPNISLPYIFYQLLLMVGTILGPGTIFMMLVGAFVAAFKISNMTAFIGNIVPICLFMLVCLFMKSKHQLMLAQLLTALYALLMMAVIVGTALQLQEDGIASPSGIFLLSLTASFVICGLLHPQEIHCLPAGFVYYLTVPSMYLLLIIYSVFNLNDVSWGTREVPKKLTKAEEEAQQKALEEAAKNKKNKSKFVALMRRMGQQALNQTEDEGSYECSFAGLFKIMCCTRPKEDKAEVEMKKISESLDRMFTRLDRIERMVDPQPTRRSRANSLVRRPSFINHSGNTQETISPILEDEHEEQDVSTSQDGSTESHSGTSDDESVDENTNPYWLNDEALPKGETVFLKPREITFFKQLIETYLKPLDNDPKTQAKVKSDLKELRNTVVAAFIMFNAVFVLTVFLLQLNKDTLHIDWPLGVKTNISYLMPNEKHSIHMVEISKQYLELEPIGLVFVIFFAVILIVQFVAMIWHRMATFSQIMATTDIFTRFASKATNDKTNAEIVVNYVKKQQRLRGVDDETGGDGEIGGPLEERRKTFERRNTVTFLEKNREQLRRRHTRTLDAAFQKRFQQDDKLDGLASAMTGGAGRRMTMAQEVMRKSILKRRDTLFQANAGRRMTSSIGSGPGRASMSYSGQRSSAGSSMGGYDNSAFQNDASDEPVRPARTPTVRISDPRDAHLEAGSLD